MTRLLAWLSGLVFFLAMGQAKADFVLVTSSAALVPTDHLLWSSLGPDGTSRPTPFTLTSSVNHTVVTVSDTAGFADPGFQVQTAGGSNFPTGHFQSGDVVLWNEGLGATTMDFGSKFLAGAGARIQPHTNGTGAFTARITALDRNLQPFTGGSFTLAGNNATATGQDNSATGAPFIGIKSIDQTGAPLNNIRAVVFDFTGTGSTSDFVLGQVDALIAPEPGSLTLAGLGTTGLLGYFWRRRLAR